MYCNILLQHCINIQKKYNPFSDDVNSAKKALDILKTLL